MPTGLKLAHLCILATIGGSIFAARPSIGGEVVIFDGPVPEPAQLARILWPEASLEAPAPQRRTRGLRITNSAEAAPATNANPTAFAFLIQFGFDSSEVSRDSRRYLDSVGEMLTLPNAGDRHLMIVGHADASGAASYNQGLSERRADAVKAYLEHRFGIAPERLAVVGMGETSPLPGRNPYAERNRRVEFRAVGS